MKLFVVLVALAVAGASANTKPIGLPGFPEGRIINGHEAISGEAPFIVSLQTNKNAHYCGGSIVKANVVITAAHCLIYDTYQVVAGAHNYKDKSETQVRQGSKERQVIHEKYGGGVGPYDIGLIFLDVPFDLNAMSRDGSAPVASIPMANNQFSAAGNGVLFGWGRDNSGSLPDKLQTLDVDIIGYPDCAKALPRGNKLADSNICSYTAGTTDGACNGDSGGPLCSKRADGSLVLVGIVSWGYTPCATTKYPSVYTSISSYQSWIEEEIEAFTASQARF